MKLKFVLFAVLVLLNISISYGGERSDSVTKYFANFPKVRFIRVYGEASEKEPPILILRDEPGTLNTNVGSSKLIIEFDIDSPVPPNLFARFYFCSWDWKEDDNVFLNDITANRTSNIFWNSAPIKSTYYTFRGFIEIPNSQVKFRFAGNWKVKIFDYNSPEMPLAEAKFFVVKPQVNTKLFFYSDFYKPERNITSSAYNIEVVVSSVARFKLIENYVNKVVLYRNHRWNEPFVINESYSRYWNPYFQYTFSTQTYGFLSIGKVFRIEGIPAENGYRVLDLTDLARYPSLGNNVVRMPISDIRRRGSYLEYDDDGAFISRYVASNYDEYVLMEFVLDPEGWQTNKDVFVVGSFNNWLATKEWQMSFDEDENLYKLRQWVRRGRHNYLYATGRHNYDLDKIESVAFDEFEGNTVTSNHTFIAFVYYRNTGYGGYDEIVGVISGSYFSSFR